MGRAASNARAALRLVRAGYYDEALGVVRQIGEIANLVCLFVQSNQSHEEWLNADEKDRRVKFSPVEVRQKLGQLTLPIPMPQEIYGLISRQSIHVNPRIAPQNYNPLGLPTLGGYFQEDGAEITLNHLGDMIGFVLGFGSLLIHPSNDQNGIIEASVELWVSIGGVNLITAQEHWNEIRESSRFKRAEAVLRQRQCAMRMVVSEHHMLSEAKSSSPDEVL